MELAAQAVAGAVPTPRERSRSPPPQAANGVAVHAVPEAIAPLAPGLELFGQQAQLQQLQPLAQQLIPQLQPLQPQLQQLIPQLQPQLQSQPLQPFGDMGLQPQPQLQPLPPMQGLPPMQALPQLQPQQLAFPQAAFPPGVFPQSAFLQPAFQQLTHFQDPATQQIMAMQMQQAQLAQQAAMQQAQQVAYQQQMAAYQHQLLAAYGQMVPQAAASQPLSFLASQGPIPLEIPGVTDTRFDAKVVMVNKERTFGFISCPPEISESVGRKDLFIHKQDILTLQVGEMVSFGVKLHKDGRPQARDIMPSTALAPAIGLAGMLAPGAGIGALAQPAPVLAAETPPAEPSPAGTVSGVVAPAAVP